MNRNTSAVSAFLVAIVLAVGCSPSDDESEEPLPDETPKAFAEFSDVQLPETSEEPEITVERNESDEPRYRVHMTGTEDEVDDVCGQVGNYLPHVDEDTITAEADELGVPQEEIEAADQDNIHGCSAVIQTTGVDVNALVLKPDEDDDAGTASMYLSAEPFESR